MVEDNERVLSKEQQQALNYMFDTFNRSFKICLAPAHKGKCRGPIGNAHAIQERKLAQLAVGGKVVVVYLRRSGFDLSTEFRLLGKGRATTFTGLCNYHDQRLFGPIEKKTLDFDNSRHRFLLAYRVVLRELYERKRAVAELPGIHQNAANLGVIAKNDPLDAHNLNVWRNYARDLGNYKFIYDYALLHKDYDQVEHRVLKLPSRAWGVAAISLFYSTFLPPFEEPPAYIAMNVLPNEGSLWLMFSFLRIDRETVLRALDPFFYAQGDELLYVLSRLILKHCENFVLSPTLYEKHKEEQHISTIKEYFDETRATPYDDYDDPRLFLFP